MSQYIHEIVLQDFITENFSKLNISVNHKNTAMEFADMKHNKDGTFWDLNGKLENGTWIPVEVEWLSSNFEKHKHHCSKDFAKFQKENGTLLVLRKNKEVAGVKQVEILENIAQSAFEKLFNNWFSNKSKDYSSLTLNEFLVGNYKRNIPRILVIPISHNARNNYFSGEPLYRKNGKGPLLLGFKETGYNNNEFVRDIQEGDICVFIDSDGNRCKRHEFISNIKQGKIKIHRLKAFKIETRLYDIKSKDIGADELYWPDEIKDNKLIYPYRSILKDDSFMDVEDKTFPYIKEYSEDKWESFRSCFQYGRYFEISPLDYVLLISNI